MTEEKKPFVNVLAIDPGGTTGCAVRASTGQIMTFACVKPEEVFDFIFDNKDLLEQVVIENFNAQTIGKWGLFTVRIVGGVYALCYEYKIPHKVHQPQDRYPFKQEAREVLKKRGVCIHEIEACEHLLKWEYDNGIG